MGGAQDRGRDDVETVNSLEEFNDSTEMRDDIFFFVLDRMPTAISTCYCIIICVNHMCGLNIYVRQFKVSSQCMGHLLLSIAPQYLFQQVYDG